MRAIDAELRRPSAFPYPVDAVEVVETHISWVFLAGPFAYKVKKPVNLGFVDYSTLDLRRHYCEQELRLNRRLAAGVYLAVVPITAWDGALRFEGAGEAVEYAVKMRRLDRERLLDRLVDSGRVSVGEVERLAERIAAFHAEAGTGRHIDDFGSRRVIEQNWRENFEQVRPFLGRWLSHGQFMRCYTFVQHELARLEPAFERRQRERRIRDCHGDLRCDSIWLAPDGHFEIFDCIEFNERFRFGDVASELAFLASDLDWRGRPDLAWHVIEAYVRATADEGLRELLGFYKCYRAFVRAKVESLEERGVSSIEDRNRHRRAARAHFELAEWYTLRFEPVLLLTCGQVGSGKTTLARGLASILGLPVVSSDRVRKELAGFDPREPHPARFEAGLYGPAATRATYDALYALAAERLRAGESLILDATFNQADERRRALQTAQENGARAVVLNVEAPESVIYERLARRQAARFTESDAGPEVFEQVRNRFEALDGLPAAQLVTVSTAGPVADAVATAVAGLRQRLPLRQAFRRSA